MEPRAFDVDRFVDLARPIGNDGEPDGIDWDYVARVGVTDDETRCLRYMGSIEIHSVLFLRDLLVGEAARDRDMLTFLSCWAYEETQHGRAIDRFLAAAGRGHLPRDPPASRAERWYEEFETLGARALARGTRHFLATHMAWGALNEMTAALAYSELARVTENRELAKLLQRLARDERRHQAFYFQQAHARLAASGVARVLARLALERVWGPVGEGVGERASFGFIAALLFDDAHGKEQLRAVDRAIAKLPGLEGFDRVEARVGESAARWRRRARVAWRAPD
jgi:hypothetical protein